MRRKSNKSYRRAEKMNCKVDLFEGHFERKSCAFYFYKTHHPISFYWEFLWLIIIINVWGCLLDILCFFSIMPLLMLKFSSGKWKHRKFDVSFVEFFSLFWVFHFSNKPLFFFIPNNKHHPDDTKFFYSVHSKIFFYFRKYTTWAQWKKLLKRFY